MLTKRIDFVFGLLLVIGIVGATTPLVEISGSLDSPFALEGVANTLHASINLKTPTAVNEAERAPLELTIVLDRSGSMEGEKLRQCIIGIQEIISTLQTDDVFHLVTYDDAVDVVIRSGDLSNRDHLRKLVSEVKSRGWTNIYSGMEAGGNLFKTERAVRRLFLFSDGQANRGKTERPEIWGLAQSLKKKGIYVSSFGVGDDFDRDMMVGIAEHGGGEYFFLGLKDTESIRPVVKLAFQGVSGLVGTDAVLHVQGINGAVVTGIKGMQKGRSLADGYPIGDLRQSDTVKFLVDLTFSPAFPAKDVPLISYRLTYNEKPPSGVEGSVKVREVSGECCRASTTKSSGEFEAAKKTEEAVGVATQAMLWNIQEQDEQVTELLDSGQKDKALVLKKQIVTDLALLESSAPDNRDVSTRSRRAREVISKMSDDSRSPEHVSKSQQYYSSLNAAGYAARNEL